MDHSRFYAEVSEVESRAQALQQEAQVRHLLHEAKPCPLWRSRLAARLRGAAERLEPQPLPQPLAQAVPRKLQ